MTPSPRALGLLIAWSVLACAASAWPETLGPVWLAFGIGLAALGLVDAGLVGLGRLPDVERHIAGSIPVGVWSPVTVVIRPRGTLGRELEIFDHVPSSMEFRGMPRTIRRSSGLREELELRYQVLPRERGDQTFGGCDLRVRSPLGLWRRKRTVGAPSTVRIYPNFRAVMRYALLATDNRTSQLGVKKRPRRGEGLDFHQLREYREGDVLRQIDWRATARMNKLISREYQDERDQQILFLLDCGRKMHALDGNLSHFDHALNAVLLMAHVALRQGDAVGLSTFSGERRWLAPRKGAAHLNALMAALYDLRTSPRTSDYLAAAQNVAARLHKRALLVWVTNLRDEEHAELLEGTRLLARRHLVLVASMQERALREAIDAPVHDFDDALRHAATWRYLEDRRRSHERTRASGVRLIDTEPSRLPIALVNRYLEIKSQRAL